MLQKKITVVSKFLRLEANIRIYFIGERGLKPGDFRHPCGLDIHRGLIYVTDVALTDVALTDVAVTKQGIILVFKTTGEFVTTFSDGKCALLDSITIDDDGFVFVTDGRSQVKKLYIPI